MAIEAVEPQLRRISVDEYHRMADAGIFAADERVELLDGLVVRVSPQGRAHRALIFRVTEHFVLAVAGTGLQAAAQVPVELAGDRFSEPEPDLVVEPRGSATGTEALLAVEIAVSSLRVDRGLKARLYAAGGVPEYWVVDVPGRRVEVRTGPTSTGYAHLRVVGEGSLEPERFPAPPLDVGALFADLD